MVLRLCPHLRGRPGLPEGWKQKYLQPDFNDSDWVEEKGTISHRPRRRRTPGPSRIYLRRTFTVKDTNYTQLRLRYLGNRDQAAQVYLNGVRIADLLDGNRRGDYATVSLRPTSRTLLRQGKNCLAVFCYSDKGKDLSLDLGLEATNY